MQPSVHPNSILAEQVHQREIMTPAWISENGLAFYFVMSQFGPYNTYVMKAVLTPKP